MARAARSDTLSRRRRVARAPWRAVRATVLGSGRLVALVGRLVGRFPELALGVLAVVLLAIDIPTIPQSFSSGYLVAGLAGLLDVAPVVFFRRYPFPAWAATALTGIGWYVVSDPAVHQGISWSVVQFIVQVVALLAVALLARPLEILLATAVSALLTIGLLPGDLKTWFVAEAAVVVLGVLLRWLVLSRRALAAKSVETDAERSRREVLEERSRIARELHDVVAHHMSMIVVQAQSAPVRLAGMSPEVAAEFGAIEASARQALNEVRGTLGVLRDDGADRAALAPQPGLADLPALLTASRAAGLDLAWGLDLDPEHCPAATGLMLHRVLQEALANAGRHAPGAHVDVTLTHDAGAATAELVVRNQAPTRTATGSSDPSGGSDISGAADTSGGNGIPGMLTRVEAVGGTLRVGPLTDGGFAVAAQVPLAPVSDRPAPVPEEIS